MDGEIDSNALRTRRKDRIFDVLSTHQRRLVLLLLDNGELEHQSDLTGRESRDDATVEIELVHNHLPKLAEADYISWDRETGAISKGPCFDEVGPILRAMEDHADELPRDRS